ncbi:hypothetical protein AS9A_3899 [Hoyosella subflava DQS3-9A1]|uniref:Uncharacterized protein n=1 Tax=Hoyosella subflava (strain DSM 45089 / JCM 17490 / NBRC 109087 / DQS3-9A1) TaxID=443218 RepID=F6EGU7_HOYSD|nr:hypothetical protein AS9A_3899 [Hoyosella subflava DQS3-9A1]
MPKMRIQEGERRGFSSEPHALNDIRIGYRGISNSADSTFGTFPTSGPMPQPSRRAQGVTWNETCPSR